MNLLLITVFLVTTQTLVGQLQPIDNGADQPLLDVEKKLEIVKRGWQNVNYGAVCATAAEVTNFWQGHIKPDPGSHDTGIMVMYGLGGINELLSAESLNTTSIALSSSLMLINGFKCCTRFVHPLIQNDTSILMLADMGHAIVEGTNALYFAGLTFRNLARWVARNSGDIPQEW